jgi:hypothetical protein
MEKYYLMVLKYLFVQKEPASVHTMQIENIPPNFIKTIVNELYDKELVHTGVGGWVWINEKGKGYIIKHDLGIKESNLVVHIGHNISSNVVQSDLSQDNSLYSPKTTLNTPTNNKAKHPIMEKMSWAIGIIAGVMAILVALKGFGVFK